MHVILENLADYGAGGILDVYEADTASTFFEADNDFFALE
jgi:hypothetical protein